MSSDPHEDDPQSSCHCTCIFPSSKLPGSEFGNVSGELIRLPAKGRECECGAWEPPDNVKGSWGADGILMEVEEWSIMLDVAFFGSDVPELGL
jgi:hypothetical protein